MVEIEEKKTESLTDYFNRDYAARLVNKNVLEVTTGYYNNIYYDFMAGILVTLDHNSRASTVTPFSQLDRVSLVRAHEKLTSLGGTPPPLPTEATAPAMLRGLKTGP